MRGFNGVLFASGPETIAEEALSPGPVTRRILAIERVWAAQPISMSSAADRARGDVLRMVSVVDALQARLRQRRLETGPEERLLRQMVSLGYPASQVGTMPDPHGRRLLQRFIHRECY